MSARNCGHGDDRLAVMTALAVLALPTSALSSLDGPAPARRAGPTPSGPCCTATRTTIRRIRETLITVGTADDHFAHAIPANDPPFMAYYNAATHAGLTGHALADLAPTGHSATEAACRLSAAIAGHGPAFARSKVLAEEELGNSVATPPCISASARSRTCGTGSVPWSSPMTTRHHRRGAGDTDRRHPKSRSSRF